MIAIILVIGIIITLFGLYKTYRNPLWGVALVVVSTPLEPYFFIYGGFNVGRVLATVTTLIWIIYLSGNHVARRKLDQSTLLRKQFVFLVPVLLSGLVWFFEPDGQRALEGAFTFILLGTMAVMMENLLRVKEDIILISLAVSIAGVLACLPANMFFLGYDIYTPMGVDAPTDMTEETLRATTIGGNPNSLGILARNGIFACVLLMTLVKKMRIRILIWAMLLICFSGIVLSGSRTNLYGTIIMLSVLLIFIFSRILFEKKRLVFLLIGFVIIGYVGIQLVPQPVLTRLLMGKGDKNIAERSTGRYEFTRNQQKQSFKFFNQYPLLGIGLNRTYYETGNDLGAHDSVSVMVGETGLLGTLGFVFLVFWAMSRLIKALGVCKDFDSRFRIILLLGLLISMLVMGVFGGFIVPYDRTFWMTLALIYPISHMAMRSKQLGIENANHLVTGN